MNLDQIVDQIQSYDKVLEKHGWSFVKGGGKKPWSIKFMRRGWSIDIRKSEWSLYLPSGTQVMEGNSPASLDTYLGGADVDQQS